MIATSQNGLDTLPQCNVWEWLTNAVDFENMVFVCFFRIGNCRYFGYSVAKNQILHPAAKAMHFVEK